MGNEQKISKSKCYLLDFKDKLKRFASPKFSAAYVAKIAVLTAISFILYAFVKFSLPFMFPSFLDMQISELPALLAGFSMGPVSGCLVVILKCLFKMAMTGTAYVGEATDILMGVALVAPASIIYSIKKDKKHAFIGLLVGTAAFVIAGIAVNRFISIPFYVEFFFKGDFEILLNVVRPIYKNVTQSNFYAYYLLLGALPFNLIRCIIMSALAFVLYKRLSILLHWEGVSLRKDNIFGEHRVKTVEQTYALADKIAKTLDGGEIILLNGDLGAGKTTFTKGLAKSLGVAEEVTSPTFTILNVYESGRIKLNHLDMYRVESADELAELGIEDCFDDDAVTVIEWNKFENLDGNVVEIGISQDGDERVFKVSKRVKIDTNREGAQ
ncbi:MAG: tRNA (adenosine(37)-N6)-threonylcarbamoyltransferase complex ATPase subunit type 1 TsaE [Bacteroides sp.]|nr:tRNA (adenosine(37)-N6)-threonylcarbamoyltransferase complex ATPase subunit type 1 TsaE [Bacillota bacterium]MCM1393441.1 tRNA (adenosine(37)-N6)-threonylcarbamoyltransferase complex ATPase subunit type 1 TsaE [[Eubacterium] siraeum]MCM1455059.1 tRNA (adenosine(37)-N6)-threonylcarbamoyltransferase complex ATPase subunit type 1 TsaE [Bacteroides sp.]